MNKYHFLFGESLILCQSMLISEVSLERVLVLEYFITETTVDLTPSQVNIHHVGLGVLSVLEIFPTQLALGTTALSGLVSHHLEIVSHLPCPATFKGGKSLVLQVSEATATGFVNS